MKKIILFIIIYSTTILTYAKEQQNNFFKLNSININQIKQKLKQKQFNDVISILNKFKNTQKIDNTNAKIKIYLIYAYYKNNQFNMTQKEINSFKLLYPHHPNMDYVLYLEGLLHFSLDKNFFLGIFPIQNRENDPIHALNAFVLLSQLIFQYPNTKYVYDIKKELVLLKNRLIEHDFSILQFYYRKCAYNTVISRGKEILQNYASNKYKNNILILIKDSYNKIHLSCQAEKLHKIYK